MEPQARRTKLDAGILDERGRRRPGGATRHRVSRGRGLAVAIVWEDIGRNAKEG